MSEWGTRVSGYLDAIHFFTLECVLQNDNCKQFSDRDLTCFDLVTFLVKLRIAQGRLVKN